MTGIVESKKSHVATVYNNLREADRNEIEALGKDPFTSLMQGFKESAPCYTWMYEDEPSALFGCVPYTNDAAAVCFGVHERAVRLANQDVGHRFVVVLEGNAGSGTFDPTA